MKEYPVKFYLWDKNKELSFNEFLKSNVQNREEFEVNVELRFYIKWVPNYKMIESIKSYISNYKNTQQVVSSWIKKLFNNKEDLKESKNILLKEKYEKSNDYLKSINQEVKKFESILKKWTGIDDLYKKTLEFNRILINIRVVLWLPDITFDEEVIDQTK